MEVFKEFRFEAAHRLTKFPKDHKCHRLHGHSYRVRVSVRGVVDQETGIVLDFAEISAAWKPLFGELDHQYLNSIPGLENPTAENLAVWIWRKLSVTLQVLAVEVWETEGAGVRWVGWETSGSGIAIKAKKS